MRIGAKENPVKALKAINSVVAVVGFMVAILKLRKKTMPNPANNAIMGNMVGCSSPVS